MPYTEPLFYQPWDLFTRLGEAQILLPAMLVSTLWLVFAAQATRLALAWWAGTAAAALITTATKIAFIGWEVGYAPLNFAGISGHAMFAAAVLPVLVRAAVGTAGGRLPLIAAGAGCLLALLIAVSRVKVGAHSYSESAIGFALGGLSSGLTLRACPVPPVRIPAWLPAGLLVWMLVLPLAAPPSFTHNLVTRLALKLSGRSMPYTRTEMLQAYRAKQFAEQGLR